MINEVYLIPEIHPNNPFFIWNSAEQITLQSIPVQGFKIYVDTHKLDSYSSDFYVIAVPEPIKTCKLYPVRFKNEIPDFSKYGFSTQKTPHGSIVYMEIDDFWKYNSKNQCVSIKGGDWAAQKRHYKTIAALYHISILPGISKSAFRQEEAANKYEKEVQETFGEELPLRESISSIFKKTLFALDFFGFAENLTDFQKTSLDYIKKRSKQNKICIAFSQIAFLIENYNKKCYNITGNNSEILMGFAYQQLIDSITIVSTFLNQLGYHNNGIDDDESLLKGIKYFQEQNKIPVTGICDSNTLHYLWEKTIATSSEVVSIMNEIGNKSEKSERKKMLMQLESTDTDEQAALLDHLNAIIGRLPVSETAEEFLRANINNQLCTFTQRCGLLAQRINNIAKRANSSCEIMNMIKYKNAQCDARIEEAADVLDKVVEDHLKAQQQFVEIREHVVSQRKRNRFFQMLSILIFLYYIIRLVWFIRK